ncbi:cyclopropane-fatty-acyl-phospholipid synthase [Chitinophaga skermanii]|uniref:Cyclopropane-fatty-acyl-phospholipid synthase n=1 Tax=Chitinophaga skermanii TaxID=331697 RepID=A0A327R1Z8_9BACT|nr:cyclopropane fatty acyl phospholipid synthase [Chitinophaga skermanii]RAJ10879.1 cyclopropane-fatty-acyl-phospholipid synthase [Chitinophaga skermanii]
MKEAKKILTRLLEAANIHVNGSNPWDIQVHDERFYRQVLSHGTLALGESYMAKWWDCAQLDELFTKVLIAHLDTFIKADLKLKLEIFWARVSNLQRPSKAYEVGEQHYDIGNDLFEVMLDKRLTYTCAFWQHAHTLDEAQAYKLDLSCRKLHLQPGMHVLDIGCGWGSFAKFAAENYGVKVTGITISKEQAAFAQDACKGLPVDIQLMDYRLLTGQYDAIASLGMFEHVGYKNYRQYMQVAHQCLKDDGLFLLHTIGGNHPAMFTDAWLNKYIFPNAMIPTMPLIDEAMEGLFIMEHWQNFGTDYDKTLMAWYGNVVTHWPALSAKYSETFFRMWSYYLLSCAGSFRARNSQLWQLVLSKNGIRGGYAVQPQKHVQVV